MKINKVKITDLKLADYNPRRLTTKQYNDLKSSLEKFGLVDPIIVNSDNTVIGGHQRLKIIKELGATEVPTVRLNLSKEDEKELNIRLNKNTGEFDLDILANNFDIDELKDWGFKEIELGFNIDKINGEDPYTKKIESPIYDKQEDKKPQLKDLLNEEKAMKVIDQIEKSKVSDKEKTFLKMAAMRHLVFDYKQIAEYYAHSNKEMQELMEDTALVIVDFKKAIEEGYTALGQQIIEQYENEWK
tara:strand:+ start:289 stop:1020 length:732 start_codon:yes stop_codon:yes gene_type:complete